MARLRAVLFDLWGTLVADDPALAERRRAVRTRAARDMLASLGVAVDETAIDTAFASADDEHGRIHAEQRDLTARGRTMLYLRHLDGALPSRLDEAAWQALDRAILEPALVTPPAPVEGAAEALVATRALGARIGLVSNSGTTPGFVLRQILDSHGLLDEFDVTVFSDEQEVCKPAPAIFGRALDALGVRADESAFVGDQPVLDVLGAKNAGLWSVQLGELSEDGIEPDARIGSLDGLLPALRSLGLLDKAS